VDPPQEGNKLAQDDQQRIIDMADALFKVILAAAAGATTIQAGIDTELLQNPRIAEVFARYAHLKSRILNMADDAILRLLEKVTR
jgi:hypothetical protein